MIISCAVKFHIDKTDKDVVLCGVDYNKIFNQIEDIGFDVPRKGYDIVAYGFITHTGKFLNAEEAWKHAYECGQISKIVVDNFYHSGDMHTPKLQSEDLWLGGAYE